MFTFDRMKNFALFAAPLAAIAALGATRAEAAYRFHTYHYHPENLGGDHSVLGQAFERDYVYSCEDDGSVKMLKDWPGLWSASNKGLTAGFAQVCYEHLKREREAELKKKQDAEAEHARQLLEGVKAEEAKKAKLAEKQRLTKEAELKAAEEADLAKDCSAYYADPTNARWDKDPGFVSDCNSLTGKKKAAAKVGEKAGIVCTEEVSADRAEAWRLSREANELSKQGKYAEARAKYEQAEAALKRVRSKVGASNARCVNVAKNGVKPNGSDGSGGNPAPGAGSQAYVADPKDFDP